MSSSSVDPIILATTSIQFVICSCGFVFNGFLAFVIARNRQLRPNSCGLLIMWLAIFDAIAEFSLISVPFVLTISGWTIPLRLCFFIESYGPCFNALTQWMMFAISLDRLYSILLPIPYKIMAIDGKSKYVAAIILIPAIGTFVSYEWGFYAVVAANPEKQVYCMPTDFIQGPMANWGVNIAFVETLATVCMYLLIAALLKIKFSNSSSHHQSGFDRRVFRSLFLLMGIQFFCWLPSNGFGALVQSLLGIPGMLQSPIYRLVIQLNKMSQAINLPILYICSVEYRRAIRKELANLCGICKDEQPGTGAAVAPGPGAMISTMAPPTSNIGHGREPNNNDRIRNNVPLTNNFV